MNYNKNVAKLTLAARNGDIEARNLLLEMNNELIVKIANTTYDEIKKNYINYYNIDRSDNNFIMPNNIISYEDILQDFYQKSVLIIKKYFSKNTNIYLSQYLNHYLSSYKNTYVKTVSNKIIEINNKEDHISINSKDFNFINNLQRQNIINEIMDVVSTNKRLNYYHDFISYIFDDLSYDELSKKTNLTPRRIGIKIKVFADLYKKQIDMNKNILPGESDDIILYRVKSNMIETIPYYDKLIKDNVDIIYQKLNNYNINYEEIKLEFYGLVKRNIHNYFNENDKSDLISFNKFFISMIKDSKNYYINARSKNAKVLKKHYKLGDKFE